MDNNCSDIGSFEISHMTIFNKEEMLLNFISKTEQLNAIQLLLPTFTKFTCEGDSMIINVNNFNKVRIRFDSINN